MYDLRSDNRYISVQAVNTRQAQKINFKTDLVQLDLHKRSPYYCGSTLWNNLNIETQRLDSKPNFKSKIRESYQREPKFLGPYM